MLKNAKSLQLRIRALEPSEIVRRPNHFNLMVIDTPTDAELYSETSKSTILELLSRHGAILIRGRQDFNQASYEQLLASLKIELAQEYQLGLSPRTSVGLKTFTSTEAPPLYPISAHTELAYNRKRPAFISFFCDIAPKIYGETPIVDCAGFHDACDPLILKKLQDVQLGYRRYFLKKKPRYSYEKQISSSFGTEDRQQVEAICNSFGMSYEWQSNGDLVTYTQIDPIVVHPHQKVRCLNLNLFHKEAINIDFEQIADRFHSLKLAFLGRLQSFMRQRKQFFVKTLWGDRSPITDSEARLIHQTMWNNTLVFSWKKGDILLLDNIQCGHGRLNVEGPRRILTAFGNIYDVNDRA